MQRADGCGSVKRRLSTNLKKTIQRRQHSRIALPREKRWEGGHFKSAAAKSLQSCLTLCDPIDGSPPGSSVPGILQARTLEWVAISFSNA